MADAAAYQDVAVTPVANQSFHFSAVLRGSSTGQARVYLQYLNSSKTVLAAVPPDSGRVNPATWTLYAVDFVPPSGTAFIRIRLETHAPSGTSANAYFDSIELRAMRPTGAPPSDTDKGLIAPTAIGTLPDRHATRWGRRHLDGESDHTGRDCLSGCERLHAAATRHSNIGQSVWC